MLTAKNHDKLVTSLEMNALKRRIKHGYDHTFSGQGLWPLLHDL